MRKIGFLALLRMTMVVLLVSGCGTTPPNNKDLANITEGQTNGTVVAWISYTEYQYGTGAVGYYLVCREQKLLVVKTTFPGIAGAKVEIMSELENTTCMRPLPLEK